MKRPMVSIDEYMSMTDEEIKDFTDRDEKLLSEGLIDENEPNVDLMGMSDEEIITKYHCSTLDDFFDKLIKKLER